MTSGDEQAFLDRVGTAHDSRLKYLEELESDTNP